MATIRKNQNGLYLDKFEEKEEALEYIDDMIDAYKYTPYKKKSSVNKMVQEAKMDGVKISHYTFTKFLEDKGVDIKRTRNIKSRTSPKTYTINNDVLDVLDSYSNKSYIVELGLRMVLGLPTEDIVLFLPTDDEPITVIFKKEKSRYKALINGETRKRDEKDIRTMLNLITKKGLRTFLDYLETFNYKYYGGHKW